MTRPQFVAKFWPLAVVVGGETSQAPASIIAHALKEAGADNRRAAQRHNYFGFLRAGKHLVYQSDEAGFTAYVARMHELFGYAVSVSHDPATFAHAVAYSAYLNESAPRRALYARTLTAIYRAVSKDVARLGLDRPLVAATTPPHSNTI